VRAGERVERPGVTVTDFRGTEQELWDEDAAADDEARTLVIPPKTATEMSVAERRRTDASHDDPSAATENEDRPTLESVSASTAGTPVTRSSALAGSANSVDSVARFIAEPGLLAPSAERELDAPRRSLAALELLDAEYGAEPTEKRAPPLPPALPANVKPRSGDLPSMLLGPQISTRGDVTERVNAIPLTHPLANSIAPGGSPVSTPPAPVKRPLRSQLALGALALVMVGAGASGFLQSRGEHHAASGRRGDREHDVEQQAREAELARRDNGHAEETRAMPAMAAPQGSEALHLQHASRAVGDPLSATVQPPIAPLVHDVAPANSARSARPPAVPVAPSAGSAEGVRKLRISVGGASLRPRPAGGTAASDSAEAAQELERMQVIEAMNALTPQLRACVGEQHGVADVTLTVRAAGVVSHALVEGPFAGSSQGTCIARALRSAKLPASPFAVSHVEYPFQL
jgi:hypothetical protein